MRLLNTHNLITAKSRRPVTHQSNALLAKFAHSLVEGQTLTLPES